MKSPHKHNAFHPHGMSPEHLKKMKGLKPIGPNHSDEELDNLRAEDLTSHPSEAPLPQKGGRR